MHAEFTDSGTLLVQANDGAPVLAGRVVRSFDVIEVLTHAGWLRYRFESSASGQARWMAEDGLDGFPIELDPGTCCRWPTALSEAVALAGYVRKVKAFPAAIVA